MNNHPEDHKFCPRVPTNVKYPYYFHIHHNWMIPVAGGKAIPEPCSNPGCKTCKRKR